jgi:hypothetical protein
MEFGMSKYYSNMRFYNRNAPIDGKWDAQHGLGNRNSFNPGSASWHAYEEAYTRFVDAPAKELQKYFPGDSKPLLTNEQIQSRLQAFWDSNEQDWSVFDDVPESQQVRVMYPHRLNVTKILKEGN